MSKGNWCRLSTLLLLLVFVWTASAQNLQLHFVKVGQGDCTLIKLPNNRFMLVDCGSSRGGSITKVRKYLLKQLGPNPKIDWLVITHPDADHYNYLPDALQNVSVGKIYTVGPPSEFPDNACDTWLAEFDASDRIVLKGAEWNVTPARSLIPPQGGAQIHVLAANTKDTTVDSESNTRSIVLKVTHGTFDAILTGDATFDTEKGILTRFSSSPSFVDVDLLKIGHHGSRATSTSGNWATTLSPEVAVVSAAYENTYGHPAFDVVSRLETFTGTGKAHKFRWYRGRDNPENVTSYTEAIFCTSRNGNIVVESDGTTFKVSLK